MIDIFRSRLVPAADTDYRESAVLHGADCSHSTDQHKLNKSLFSFYQETLLLIENCTWRTVYSRSGLVSEGNVSRGDSFVAQTDCGPTF